MSDQRKPMWYTFDPQLATSPPAVSAGPSSERPWEGQPKRHQMLPLQQRQFVLVSQPPSDQQQQRQQQPTMLLLVGGGLIAVVALFLLLRRR